jgi:hypothetical protein
MVSVDVRAASDSGITSAPKGLFSSRVALVFGVQQAHDSCMTLGVAKHKPSQGALRAATELQPNSSLVESTAELIDRETGLRDIMDVLEAIIAEAISLKAAVLNLSHRLALPCGATMTNRSDRLNDQTGMSAGNLFRGKANLRE